MRGIFEDFAENGYAYVTLKSEDGFGLTDELDVIDIRDINNPTLISQTPMQGPTGLSVDNGQLYVCDDVAGIKIFDTSDPTAISVIDSIRNVNCNDVIADNGRLYVITETSLLQYDYTSLPPVLLSEISR